MDKQKQIEEMIRDLIPFLVKEEFVEEVLKQPFSYFDDMYEDEKAICKELIRLNYRKIPEGTVVLTREEYDELLRRETKAFIKGEKQGSQETAEKFAEKLKPFKELIEKDQGKLYQNGEHIAKDFVVILKQTVIELVKEI